MLMTRLFLLVSSAFGGGLSIYRPKLETAPARSAGEMGICGGSDSEGLSSGAYWLHFVDLVQFFQQLTCHDFDETA